MRIDHVTLKNIGPHKSLKADFNAGLIGILGANGSGKSTLTNSIYAALTNDFTRFGVVKSDIINNTTIDEQSYIRVVGSHRGQDFELTRWLRPNKNKLVFDGTTHHKANEVNQIIEEQLGMSKLIIDKYVFVSQWDMFQFIDQTPSERAKIFQYLCGTEHATQIYAACSAFIANQQKSEVIDNSLELEAAVSEAQSSVKKHKRRCKKLKRTTLLDKDALKQVQDIIERRKKSLEAQARIRDEQQRLKQAVKLLKVHIRDKEKAKKDLSAQRALLAELHKLPDYLASIDYEKNEKSRRITETELQKEKDALDRVTTSLADLSLPVKPEPYSHSSVVEHEFRNLEKMIAANNWFLQNRDKPLVCSKCRQPVAKEYVDLIAKETAEAESQVKELKAKYEIWFRYETDTASHNSVSTALTAEKERISGVVELLERRLKEYKSTISQQEVKRLLLRKQAIEKSIEAAESLLKVAEQGEASCSARRDSAQSGIDRDTEILQHRPSDHTYERAVEMLAQHKKAENEYRTSLGAYKEAKRNLESAAATLEHLRFRLNEKVKIQNLLNVVDEVGTIFHWVNLPKTVAQANLGLLVGDINENLTLFNNPFYVEADEDLTFKVFFPGQPAVKAKQLSGGQKVVLAIAFRIAIDRVFGHNVGMMFLDEPTAGLDADNVEYFHAALQQLSTRVGDNRQLVVITHVEELSSVFDQLIHISKV